MRYKICFLCCTICLQLVLSGCSLPWTPIHVQLPLQHHGLIFIIVLPPPGENQERPVYGTYITLWSKPDYRVNVKGIGVGSLAMHPKQLYGVSLSPYIDAEDIRGLAVSLGLCCPIIYGTSFGIWTDIKENYGFCSSIVNLSRENNGVLMGLCNIMRRDDENNIDSKNSVQFGLVNIASDGCQIGLFNYNPNSVIPFTLLFNYSRQNETVAQAESQCQVEENESSK